MLKIGNKNSKVATLGNKMTFPSTIGNKLTRNILLSSKPAGDTNIVNHSSNNSSMVHMPVGLKTHREKQHKSRIEKR
jgi:hypothetical protein